MSLTHLLKHDGALDFILGGNAKFTLKSLKTQTRYTYKVKNKADEYGKQDEDFRWVKLMTGSDNESSFTYMGFIRHQNGQWFFYQDKRPAAKVSKDAPGSTAFKYVFENLNAGKQISNLEIWHEGSCGRCGRTLTVPESIESGFGPECIKFVNKKSSLTKNFDYV